VFFACLKELLICDACFKPIAFPLNVLFIFFEGPKKTNQKKCPFPKVFFEGFLAKTFKNRHKKQLDLQNFHVSRAFYGYTDEKDG
jgi:hypothetical protein